jgi:hypothetical protein
MVTIPIWPGSSSFSIGDTPFGFYDNDLEFAQDADKVATWCARRLGYPLVDVELQDINFYACFEEAVSEYSNQVNQFNIIQNMLNLQGTTTTVNLTGKPVNMTLSKLIELSNEYGQEALVGGNIDVKTGSIQVYSQRQRYDLNELFRDVYESGSTIEIKKVFHYRRPASARFFDPYLGNQAMLDTFGFGNYSTGVSFLLMPMYADALRMQQIELNDMLRKSGYGFDLRNNKLTLHPVPTEDYKLYFEYIVKEDRSNASRNFASGSNLVSDPSNAPYEHHVYDGINSVGRQWIFKYTLALAKEMLGYIRGKYDTLPIPNSEVTLNHAELIAAAQNEKEDLVSELRKTLEQTRRTNQLQLQKEEAKYIKEQLNLIPLKIYIG